MHHCWWFTASVMMKSVLPQCMESSTWLDDDAEHNYYKPRHFTRRFCAALTGNGSPCSNNGDRRATQTGATKCDGPNPTMSCLPSRTWAIESLFVFGRHGLSAKSAIRQELAK